MPDVTITELAQRHGIPPTTLRSACQRFLDGKPNGLKCRRSGRTILISEADFRRWQADESAHKRGVRKK